MVALDQMDGGRVPPGPVLALLDCQAEELRDAAWWVAGHHPEWGGLLAGYFAARLDCESARRLDRRGRDSKPASPRWPDPTRSGR